MKKIRIVLPLFTWSIVCLSACNNGTESADHKSTASTTKPAPANQSRYEAVNTWINDFKNFRTAVYENDIAKQKTYFNFPVNADTTQIWDAVYDQADETTRPSTFPSVFTTADYDKYHQGIFNDNFVKSLLKVDSEQLSNKGEYTTPKLNNGKESFYMMAYYDKATTTLQLTLSYPGGTDEQGDYVSEGEYALIYIFKVDDNKYLRFDKILSAG